MHAYRGCGTDTQLRPQPAGVRLAVRGARAGGTFLVPIDTPYDRQMLLEHVDRGVRLHGAVRLEFRDQEWTVSRGAIIHGIRKSGQASTALSTNGWASSIVSETCNDRATAPRRMFPFPPDL